ncbi:MAG: uracil-DNA glycosylase [Gammaproteobacteria bacterium]|jgi:DNA polymerase
MNSELRHEYLKAMGIQQWVARNSDAATAEVEPAPEQLPADSLSAWQVLEKQISVCTRCALHEGRTQTVFGTGDRNADWMIIGEAPGAEEDRRGEPFVGRAGKLLDEILFAAGYRRADVFIANILKCRPPANRDPSADEIRCCQPYLQRQIELIQPKLILAVGRIAAHGLLQTTTQLGRLRGRVHYYGDSRIPLVVTYHPAYLLRTPLEKRKVWQDLQFARAVYSQQLAE